MIYEIEPLDNFFFRNPAPFEAGGEAAVMQSQFPPLPAGYAGAFRFLTKDPQHGARSIKIGFNGVMLGETFYFPMPLDMYPAARSTKEEWKAAAKELSESPLSSYPFRYMLRVPAAPKDKARPLLYLSEDTLRRYLQGGLQECGGVDMNQKIVWETKLGIQMDYASGVSENHRLYQLSCFRPKKDSGFKLAAEVKAELEKESGVLKLGGEEKKAAFRPASRQLCIDRAEGDGKYFKLYLATPAVFGGGWLPGWIDEKQMTGYFSHDGRRVRVRLISACTGRSVPCGGYGKEPETGKYRPRELRYAVPAGSVYYFELLEGTFRDAVKLFSGKCISEYRENLGFEYQMLYRRRYCDRGFGYSLVGKLDKKQEEILNVR